MIIMKICRQIKYVYTITKGFDNNLKCYLYMYALLLIIYFASLLHIKIIYLSYDSCVI